MYKVCSLSTYFFPFAWNAICCLHKTLCWRVGTPYTCCISAPPLQNDVLEVHLAGSDKDGSWRVLDGEDKGLSHLPVLQKPSNLLCELICLHVPFWMDCGTSVNKNSTNISTLCQEMLATTLLSEGCTFNFFSLILPT